MSQLLDFILTHEEAFRSRARLASLYSDFRNQQILNPDGYAANLSAWRKALANASRAGLIPGQHAENELLSLRTGDELLRALETEEFGRPVALAAVVQDAVERKELIPLKDFLGSKTSIYHRSWVPSPWQVVQWGLRQIGLTGGGSGDRLAVGNFVLVANVEAAANAILKQASNFSSNTDRIFTSSLFHTTFSHILSPSHPLTSSDLTILLRYLSRDKAAISVSSNNRIIKFHSSTSTSPEPITQQDETIASLRSLILSLTEQVSSLTKIIDTKDAAAREALAKKNRTAALSALRTKKATETTLNQRTATLTQLEEVYNKISQASDNVEIVRVMEASAGVLKSLHREVGGVDRVSDVVDALREEMENVDEVTKVIGEAGEGVVVDEGEIDEELEALEREGKEAREKEEAEATRLRLAELERVEVEKRRVEEQERAKEQVLKVAATQSAEEKREGESVVEEPAVEEDIEKMGRMSLDEPREERKEAQPAT